MRRLRRSENPLRKQTPMSHLGAQVFARRLEKRLRLNDCY